MNPLIGVLLALPDDVSTGDCDWSPLPESRNVVPGIVGCQYESQATQIPTTSAGSRRDRRPNARKRTSAAKRWKKRARSSSTSKATN